MANVGSLARGPERSTLAPAHCKLARARSQPRVWLPSTQQQQQRQGPTVARVGGRNSWPATKGLINLKAAAAAAKVEVEAAESDPNGPSRHSRGAHSDSISCSLLADASRSLQTPVPVAQLPSFTLNSATDGLRWLEPPTPPSQVCGRKVAPTVGRNRRWLLRDFAIDPTRRSGHHREPVQGVVRLGPLLETFLCSLKPTQPS